MQESSISKVVEVYVQTVNQKKISIHNVLLDKFMMQLCNGLLEK